MDSTRPDLAIPAGSARPMSRAALELDTGRRRSVGRGDDEEPERGGRIRGVPARSVSGRLGERPRKEEASPGAARAGKPAAGTATSPVWARGARPTRLQKREQPRRTAARRQRAGLAQRDVRAGGQREVVAAISIQSLSPRRQDCHSEGGAAPSLPVANHRRADRGIYFPPAGGSPATRGSCPMGMSAQADSVRS
jgi:hypothetical protein